VVHTLAEILKVPSYPLDSSCEGQACEIAKSQGISPKLPQGIHQDSCTGEPCHLQAVLIVLQVGWVAEASRKPEPCNGTADGPQLVLTEVLLQSYAHETSVHGSFLRPTRVGCRCS
jgi:hypothetical protein